MDGPWTYGMKIWNGWTYEKKKKKEALRNKGIDTRLFD